MAFVLKNLAEVRLLAETFLIITETYTENAETILNHIKNPAETLPKCRNPHLPKLPKPCRNYSKHIVKSCRNLSQDFGEVLASNLILNNVLKCDISA